MMQSKVESSLLQRKRIRLGRENYLGGRSCFVTICCRDRRPFFQAQGKRADLRIDPYNASVRLIELLREVAAKESFRVHAYCIMPDHVHILVEGTDVKSNLLQFVRILKLRSAFEAKRMSGGQLWQRSYYEHILRPAESTEWIGFHRGNARRTRRADLKIGPYRGGGPV